MTVKDLSYPLIDHADGSLQTSSGRSLAEMTMENVESGVLAAQDMQIDAKTLRSQAEIAAQAGLPQLAANLVRAAELTAVPNETLLRMYEMLRPGRSRFEELNQMAANLEEQFEAAETAQMVREAAEVYRTRGLLRRER